MINSKYKCKHNPILPLVHTDILGFVITFILSICASIAGIGGGVYNVHFI